MSKKYFMIAAVVAAATVGDGAFALPYMFSEAGWLVVLCYLLILGSIVVMAHAVYLATLKKVGEKERLLGLAKKYLGNPGFWVGFLAIVIGLLLTLVAYMILGIRFIHLALPMMRDRYAFLIFLALISLPIFLDDRRVAELEMVGIVCTTGIVGFIFFSAFPNITFAGVPMVNWQNIFLPFGATLFGLAGWTSIEPAYEIEKSSKVSSGSWKALAGGTFFAAMIYALFSAGILGSSSVITPDTVSGLAQWPLWKKDLLALMGLIAVATVYMPISREIKNALEIDLKRSKLISRVTIVLLPPLLILAGFNNFLVVVGVVGGLFLSTQYLLIVLVGRKALKLSLIQQFFLELVALIFMVAAVYSVWVFIVR